MIELNFIYIVVNLCHNELKRIPRYILKWYTCNILGTQVESLKDEEQEVNNIYNILIFL